MTNKMKGSAWLVIGLFLIYHALTHAVNQSLVAIIGAVIGACFVLHYITVQEWIKEENIFS